MLFLLLLLFVFIQAINKIITMFLLHNIKQPEPFGSEGTRTQDQPHTPTGPASKLPAGNGTHSEGWDAFRAQAGAAGREEPPGWVLQSFPFETKQHQSHRQDIFFALSKL